MGLFEWLFDLRGFPARWHCGGGWREEPWLGWLHIGSDLGIWSAYFAIPLVLVYFAARKRNLPFRRIFLLFGSFILLCGLTHLTDAIIFWWPAYRFAGVLKLVTAVVSWTTVFALGLVIPRALQLRSPEDLEREIEARKQAEAALAATNSDLEQRVRERTAATEAANAKLSAERELLRTTLASIGDGVIVTDADGRVTFLNGVAELLTGWSNAAASGQPLTTVFNIVNEETRLEVENPAARALREGVVVGLANHTVLIAKDGQERCIDDSAAPIRTNAGEVVGCVLVFRDISDRKQAEQESRRNQELIQSVNDNTNELIFVKDRSGRLTYANAATLRVMGMSREQALAADEPARFFVPAELATIAAHDRRVLETGETVSGEEPYTCADGETRVFLSTKTPLRDERGQIIGVIGVSRDITQQKLAAEQLQAGEERLRLANRVASIGTFEWNIQTGENVWAPELESIYGLPPGEFVGTQQGWEELVHPDDRRLAVRHVADSLEHGDFAGEWRIVRPDGAIRWVAGRGHVFQDEQGRPLRLLGVNIDITDRKEAEQKLQESQQTLFELIERCPFGIYIVDDALHIVSMNAGSHSGAFNNVRPVIGRPFGEAMHILWPAAVAEEIIASFRHTLETGEPFYSKDFVRQRADVNRTEGYEWQLHRLMLATGRPCVVCYYYDATQLRQVERELSVEVASMNRLHELVVRLLGQSQLSTAMNEVLNAAVDLLSADMGTLHVMDLESRQLRLIAHRGFFLPPVDQFQSLGTDRNTSYGRALDSGRRVVIEDVQQDQGYARHQEIVIAENWHGSQSTPLLSRNGEVLGMLSTHYRGPQRPVERDLRILDLYAQQAADFIERLRTEQSLRQLAADLSEVNRKKDEFLATLAHELRNPLAPIRSGLELIKLAAKDETVVDHTRDMMERQLAQMVRLVDDLMDLSRISRGKIELKLQRVELAKVIDSAVEAARPLIDAMSHELVLSLPERPVLVQADPVRLSQILLNLLNNAAKYSNRGSRIWLSAHGEDTNLVLAVRDEGVGIPPDKLTQIFEMFAQVDGSLEKAQGGLGIGLNIVKRLVEMHGGRIEAKSDGRGCGSEFIARLPVIVQDAEPDAVAMPVEPKESESSLRILVVDDNQDGAHSLATMLKLIGNQTFTAYDGEAGVEIALRERPDVVLLDIGLPKLNGYEACRRIRDQDRGKDIVVIAVTGWGQEDDRRRAREAGFDHHLVKPVDPAALMKLLAELNVVEE
ncbi:MAG: PAS domain-containing protein [Planctomycetes bacterium]|nr:PAS domain-containing protein [Planctomycetota bacterium]